MLNHIKRWFFNKNLPKPIRKQKSFGLNPQKSVAILFNGTSEEDRKAVHAFKKRIKNSGAITVKSLAFINNKLPLDNIDYAAYNLKNVNWYGLPSGEKVEEFMSGPWDIVIFLGDTLENHYEYILKNINASFIIGNAIKDAETFFDLTVDTQNSKDMAKKINTIIKSIDIISIKKIS